MANDGWTINTLREHFETLIKLNDERYNERFAYQENALKKAETASEKRFDGVNEFRAILTDQQKTFITRNEWGSQHHALEDKINALENRATLSEGKGEGKHALWGYIVGGIGLISLVVTIIHVLASK